MLNSIQTHSELVLAFILLIVILIFILTRQRSKNKPVITEEEKSAFLNKLLPGDVLVVRDKIISSLPIVLIRLANFSKLGYDKRLWNHCAIYIGNNEIIEAFPKGVERNKLAESYLNNKFEIVAIRKKSASKENLLKAIEYCTQHVGKKYDYGAVVYFLLLKLLPSSLDFVLNSKTVDKCLNKKDAFFCSELVADGLLKANEYTFDRDPDKIMPVDFYNDLCFDTVVVVKEDKKESSIKKVLLSGIYWVAIVIWLTILSIITIIIFTAILGSLFFIAEKLFSKKENDKIINESLKELKTDAKKQNEKKEGKHP